MLDLWQQLTSSSPGVLQGKGSRVPGQKEAVQSSGNSLDDFVVMENRLAVGMCALVDSTLSALKKVHILAEIFS